MKHPPPSRRRFLSGLGLGAFAALGMGFGATGCAAPDALGAAKTRVRYWNLFGGGDGVNMQGMLDAFRKDHPEIQLEATTLAWGAPYYTKLAMAGAGGRAPEVAVLHLSRLPGFAPGRLLDPFDLGLLAEFGVRSTDFPAEIWQRGTVGGKQYAVPLDTHPFVLYYNTEVCRKAGLLGPDGKLKPISGADAFTAALKAAKAATGKPGISFETLGSGTVGPWRLFSALYSQTGGQIFDAAGTRLAIDDAKALKVLQYMRMLTDSGLAPKQLDYPGAVATFASGGSAFFFDGEWEVSSFQTAKLPFGMARIPALLGPTPSTQADCHTFVLPHQLNRGGEANRAAHAFIAWMLKHSISWAQGGHIPAYSPVRDSTAYHRLEPQSEYASVIDQVVLDPPTWFSGSASQLEIEIGATFSDVLTGTASPQQALNTAKAQLTKLLATPNPFGDTLPTGGRAA